MTSPFVYDEPLDPAMLVGRSRTVELLREHALDGRNSRLEGPRRFGKTSLLRAVLEAARSDGAIAIEVNFLGCVTASDVAERFELAYREQLDRRLQRWLDALARTWRPTISAAPGGVGVSAEPRVSSPGLLERLALPRRLHERDGRTCVIAFDEFQEVFRIDPALPGAFRSVIEGNSHAAAYLFCGSHPGLMQELFSDRRHAFFGQAAPIEVGPLPPVELADFLTDRFAERGRELGDAFAPLLDASEGHPQRTMLLAHHLYSATPKGRVADLLTWTRAQASARREAHGEIQIVWDLCSDLERRVLKTIAHRTVPLSGKEAQERFGLAKSGSTQVAVERLVRDGTLVADETTRTGWRVVDPFLAAWLRGE
ncbi:MAG TPA: ATP-binding protein [Conexibacter sp.]|nr:ATP-binding protein [Conexibacter sp.]